MKLGDALLKTSTIRWKEVASDKAFRYVDLTSVDRKTHNIAETSEINARNAPSRAQKIIQTGDVLFGTTRPTLNRLCIVPDEYDDQICSTGLCVLRANEKLILPSYIYYLLNTTDFIKYVEANQRGTSYPAVTDSDIKNFNITLPSLEEQEKIVAKLDAAHEKISKAEMLMKQNIENVNMLQRSILAKYLDAANDTHTHRLGEICAVLGGKRVPKGEKLLTTPTEHPYIRVTDFDGRGGVDTKDLRYLSEKIYSQISRYIITKNDIFLSIAGTIGVTGIIPDELDGANLTENACRLVPNENVDKKYLYYFTTSESFKSQAFSEIKQTAQPKLALTRIKNISIPLPSRDEQAKTVSRLDELFGKMTILRKSYGNKLKDLNTLRQSLLYEAFAG